MSYFIENGSRRNCKQLNEENQFSRQSDNYKRINIPMSLAITQNDDTQLMEIEVQLEGLKTLLQKNEQYGQKLRLTLQKIDEKHKSNIEKLKELHQKKNEMQQKAKVNKYGFLATYGQNLYGHKIQGISFYSFETYQRLDCIQAFELMSKKNNKMLKQNHHHLMNSYYSLDSDKVIEPNKEEKLQNFFDKLPLLKSKFTKQQKSASKSSVNQQSQYLDVKEEMSSIYNMDGQKKFETSDNSTSLYQEFIESAKKEFLILLIFNFLDEQIELSNNKQNQQSSSTAKKQIQQNNDEIVKQILSAPSQIYHYIDWIEFAKFANLIINKYGATSMVGYVEALDIFSIFKQLFIQFGEQFVFSILNSQNSQSNAECASNSSMTQSPIHTIKSKKSCKKSSQPQSNTAVDVYEEGTRKKGRKENSTSLIKEYMVGNFSDSKQISNFLSQIEIQPSEWTRQDDEKLIKAVQIFGEKRWGQVSTLLNGKEHTDIVQRWVKFLNPRIEKGRWSLREDIKLAVLYEFYTSCKEKIENKTWCLIANHFTNRTEVQIRERWCNLLDPKMKFTSWSKQEDTTLLQLGVKYQGQWAKISRELENKTDNQVLRRWKLLLSDRYNINLIKYLELGSINLRKEYLKHHGLIEDYPIYKSHIQNEQNLQNDLYPQPINVKEENQELSFFLPQIKNETTSSQIPEQINIFKDYSFSCAYQYKIQQVEQSNFNTLEKQFNTIEQPKIQNPKKFTLKRDDEDDNQMEIEQPEKKQNKFDEIIRISSLSASIPHKTKNIFKLIKLTPSLANQIRKDNLKRREKKKYKQKPAGYKQRQFLVSASQIDNTSTFRSNYGEDDDSDDNSQSAMNFTEYQSDTNNNDPSSYNISTPSGIKKKIAKKNQHIPNVSQSLLKIQNEEEGGYQSGSEGSEIPSN
ncbi:hypothetical protein ABPG72_002009 [Tetrahymena utriculariae]